MNAYPFRNVQAKLREVIEVTDLWGAGTLEDPTRTVTCYFDKHGGILAVSDPEHLHERMLMDRMCGM